MTDQKVRHSKPRNHWKESGSVSVIDQSVLSEVVSSVQSQSPGQD